MCGRYVYKDGEHVLEVFSKLTVKDKKVLKKAAPRYNASPMQMMPVFAMRNNEIVVQNMKWWLIPHWSKDGKVFASTFNAKAETLEQSKLYAPYFKSSRCLIPASAFYEWKKIYGQEEGKNTKKAVEEKQPMCILMKDEQPFMFAGLFSVWKNKEEEEVPTCTIITTEANSLISDIHNRMPVILPEKHFDAWLDSSNKNTALLKQLLVPYPPTKMRAYKVSRYVSNSRNEGPECMAEIK
jgi:putative SOS response-associated peptidase YedK